MKRFQKFIIIALVTAAGFSWFLSAIQPDMMDLMKGYGPIPILIFTASWTAGMAAMMFPAIVPMVLLYNRLITSEQSGSSAVVTQREFTHIFKLVLFIGMYLVLWAITGIGLLLGWSVLVNSLTVGMEDIHVGIIFGSILIISGVYQFTSLKNICIGYCESPLSFFMRRWHKGAFGAMKMGFYHGLYCLGCCWPYFLIMVALGWMNVGWMGIFALIIFAEKIWSRGVLVARATGIALIILGLSSSFGLIVLHDSNLDLDMDMDMDMDIRGIEQNKTGTSLQDNSRTIVTDKLTERKNNSNYDSSIMPDGMSM